MIGTLIVSLLVLFAAPARPIRVRDDAVTSSGSGASAESDSSLHATSRTLSSPRIARTFAPLEVEAERVRRRMPTAFVSVLQPERTPRATASLTEALAEAAGVRVVAYGGLGAFATMSLRGAPAGQTAVYLDGVPLTSASQGEVDLADLPATAIERIEVWRGAAPVWLGAPAPGGAVNLTTADAPEARRVRAARGSFGTGEARGTYATRRGAWSLLAHGGWQGSDGDFPYFDDNGTPQNPGDDTVHPRANDRFDAATALARVAWSPGPRLAASARAELFHRAQGVPGLASAQAANPRLASDRVLGASEWRAAWSDAAPSLTLRGSLDARRLRFRDSEGELGFGRQDTDERFHDGLVSLELASPARLHALDLSAGGALRRETASPAPPTLAQPTPPASRRDTRAAWLAASAGDPRDRVRVRAARRWDEQADHVRFTATGGTVTRLDAARGLDAPQLGARVRLAWGAEALGNWWKATRAPDFFELFGDQGNVQGNPRLANESSEGWDAGGRWSGARGGVRGALEWSHHETHARGLIVFQQAGPQVVRPVNVGHAELRGEELSARAAWKWLEASASTAWLSALDTSTPSIYFGRRLPQRPMRQSYARLSARAGAWIAAAEVQYLGDDFRDRINFQRAPSRTLTGASLERAIGPLAATIEGRNLGDVRATDVAGFPLPGRSVYASLEARFEPAESTR